MSKLILVRHGETEKNTQGLLHDSFDQEVLNSKGRQQIRVTAKHLTSFNLDLIFSSKESRAVESSLILSKELVIPFQEIEGLHERNWGKLSGKPWSDIKRILDPMGLDERYAYLPPGGESWQRFERRLNQAVKHLVSNSSDKSIVVVTHGGAIRALMPFLLSVPKEESFKYDPDNASVTIFNVISPNQYENVVVNSTSHLPDKLKTVRVN
ncbi:histidine phosphatase family protein [Patescibacteria group bacterium]|nr:histidine phosphatase family protein [Patescibacteria group bacterium]